jgi:Tfp pilus assembly protein PilF
MMSTFHHLSPTRHLRALLAAGLSILLGACASAPPPPASVSTLLERPAERALAAGLVDYDDGAFDRAQTDFETAVKQGLRDPHDNSVAHKHLAFIACAFNHPAECEAQFRSAFAADPGFRLSDSEIGHPIWGPVYRRVAAARAAPQKTP